MPDQCPECGAPGDREETCRERFERFLALEFSDPAYGAVHHLTVAAYMLQHPARLSARGWYATRTTLTRFLVEGLSPEELRRLGGRAVDSLRRTWSFVKGPRVALPAGCAWQSTILGVDDSTAAAYCQTVRAWANRTLHDANRAGEPPADIP